MPKENSDGYDKSSVLSYVEGIPDEPNRLLIFHGMIGMCYLSRIRFKMAHLKKIRVFDLKPEVGSFFGNRKFKWSEPEVKMKKKIKKESSYFFRLQYL